MALCTSRKEGDDYSRIVAVEERGPEVNTVGEWEYMLFVGMGGLRRVNVDK